MYSNERMADLIVIHNMSEECAYTSVQIQVCMDAGQQDYSDPTALTGLLERLRITTLISRSDLLGYSLDPVPWKTCGSNATLQQVPRWRSFLRRSQIADQPTRLPITLLDKVSVAPKMWESAAPNSPENASSFCWQPALRKLSIAAQKTI